MNFLSSGVVSLLRFTLVNLLRNQVVNFNRGRWSVCSGIGGQFTPVFPQASDGETNRLPPAAQKMSLPQKRTTWEIMSIILLSVIITTGIINFSINKRISWSELPIACCLVIFSYVSAFAFTERRTIVRIWFGFLLSAVLLLVIDSLTNNFNWMLRLGIPLLFTGNLIAIIMLAIGHHSKEKGVNLIAYAFILSALLCLAVETVLSLYFKKYIDLSWSILVTTCVLPVSAVLLFLHYRLRRGRNLKKTFHL